MPTTPRTTPRPVMRRAAFMLIGMAMLLPAPGSGKARAAGATSAFAPWHIYGSNTLRYDNFNTSGDATSSPYRFTGPQYYDELNLNFVREFSRFNRVTGSFSGLLNDSRYRSRFSGVVPERFNVRQENGEFRLPYRAEVGDLFAFQSYRTIQRSLKGVQVELQPDLGAGTRNSIVLFSGSASENWRDLRLSDGLSSGASWLVEHPVWGRAGVNLLNNYKQADGVSPPSSTQQYIYSLVYENHARLAGQRFTVEGEAGHFSGDHADLEGPGSGRNRAGNGYFAQLTGSPTALAALSYRFRYESYDQDYRPDTASIQPDRRSREGHLSWRFASGLTARARLQTFRSLKETTNPLDTGVYGVNISGPLLTGRVAGLSGGVDAFRQINKNRGLTTSTRTQVVNANLNKTINARLSARAGFFYSNLRDRNNPASAVSITRQYSAGLDFKTRISGISGIISPGLIARRVDSAGLSSWDYNPTLNVNARRGPHSLSMSYSALDQNRRGDLGVVTQTAGLDYRYTRRRYTLGLDFNWFQREPDSRAAQDTEAWRVGAFVTLHFDKPAVLQPVNAALAPAQGEGQTATARLAFDLSRLTPGTSEARARRLAAHAGLGTPTRQPGLLIWFARILRDIDQSQRLVVDAGGGAVVRSALIIDFDDVGNSQDASQVFDRVRRELLSEYGQPDAFFDQGEFGPSLGVDLAAGRFIRVMEWKVQGGVLRFGIPRRLDARVRMEVQFAHGFPPLKDSLWSFEEVQ